jgi:hypothetical protein
LVTIKISTTSQRIEKTPLVDLSTFRSIAIWLASQSPAPAEASFEDLKDVLLEELEKATSLTSFGFRRANYCFDGLTELQRLSPT